MFRNGSEVGRMQNRRVVGRIIEPPRDDGKQFARTLAVGEQTEFERLRLADSIGIT